MVVISSNNKNLFNITKRNPKLENKPRMWESTIKHAVDLGRMTLSSTKDQHLKIVIKTSNITEDTWLIMTEA